MTLGMSLSTPAFRVPPSFGTNVRNKRLQLWEFPNLSAKRTSGGCKDQWTQEDCSPGWIETHSLTPPLTAAASLLMPPPPPSKSYLLVFDTDSEDEDEGYRIGVRDVAPTPQNNNQVVFSPTLIPPSKEDADDPAEEEVEPQDDSIDVDEDCDDSSSPSKKKKKKKKRRNKKKRAAAKSIVTDTSTVTTCASTFGSSSSMLRVGFSTVTVRNYPRAFSGDAVPADGGWPLGMELAPCLTEEGDPVETTVELEDFEADKQQHLKERWEHWLQEHPGKKEIIDRMLTRPKDANEDMVWETRQWDYKRGGKNPLFGISIEEDRRHIFLGTTKKSHHNDHHKKGRHRSNSAGSEGAMHKQRKHSDSPTKHRTRSGSMSGNHEQFNETYTQVYVYHVRNELEQLRNERTKLGATGCNCRKLSVYLPPKGGGGKKAQHRRMKPSKVAQELKKRNLYNPSASREEMERALHDAVAKEPCCLGEDCFCFRNGIDCQADACRCWHDSHVHENGGANGHVVTIEDIVRRCGNPIGMATVNSTEIDAYRNNILDNGILFCQPVASDGLAPSEALDF
eukprot:Nitzschia sp. Nitz4//scaffold252_size28738//163//1885//NITZ4_008091-RA/size28738-snap-gene-0.2-mRNA-1//-1//CDS//3329544251//6321//frame0